MRYFSRSLFCSFLFLLSSIALSAQVAGTAALTGAVTDPQGAVVIGAEVKANSLATTLERSAKTDSAGKYLLSQLPPGDYRVEVRMSGFKTAVRPKVALPIGITTTVDFRLEVGAIAEAIEVQAAAAAVNTTDASIGVPLTGDEIRNLPSLDLNPAALLSLQPGVAFIPSQPDTPGGYGGVSDYDGRSGAVNGARSDQSNVTLDGVDCNDPVTGYAFTCVLRATQASLSEFRTTTANYSADGGGRSSSAQVQLITNRGENTPHGTAYYAHRNEALNANDFFLNKGGVKEPKFRRHIYGAALGGPIWKNRVYLFGNWERMQENLFKSAVRAVPSLPFRDGVMIYRCRNRAGFAPCPTTATTVTGVSGKSYTVPAGSYGLSPAEIKAIDPLGIGPDPALLQYWSQYPTDINDFTVGDGINVVGHRFAAPVNNVFNTYISRADVNLDSKGNHSVYWRGTLQDDTVNTEPQFEGGKPLRTTGTNSRGMAIGYTAVLSPTMVNNFRYGLTRISLDNKGVRDQEFANIRFIDEFHGFDNTPLRDTSSRRSPTHHFRDDFSWTRGKHSFSAGGEFRFPQNEKTSNALSFHGFTVNPSWLSDGGRSIEPGQVACNRPGCFAVPASAGVNMRDRLTLMLGPITQVDASYNFNSKGDTLAEGTSVPRKFVTHEYEFYFQDQWRFRPSLTLTLGLRYLNAAPPWEANGNEVIPVPENPALKGSFGAWFKCREANMKAGKATADCGLIQTVLGGPVNKGKPYYGRDNNNFSPRIAAAWAPRFSNGLLGHIFGDGKMSIRGGYSLVYDRMGMALVNTFDEEGAFGLSTGITSLFGGCGIGPSGARPACVRFSGPFSTSAPKSLVLADGSTQLVPSPGAKFPATPPEGLLTVSNGLDDTIRQPYAHMIDFSIGRELPGGFTVEAAYVGRRGRNLPLLRDYAMPADFCDPKSGMCAFEAARQLEALSAAGQPLATLAPIPFWENVFPQFGPSGSNGGCLQFEALGSGCGFSATQVAYDYMIGYHGTAASGSGFGTSTFWQDVDYGFSGLPGVPANATVNGKVTPFTFFPSQFVEMFTWDTIARSEYHAMQLTLRKRMTHGVSFTVNYTLSKSLDHASTPERQGSTGFFVGGYTGTTINAWEPDLEYSLSDYDMTHQVNGYFTVELPFGRSKRFGSDLPRIVNGIVGGWQISGVIRANTGVPANIINGRSWPTNWNLQGNATCAPIGANPLGLATGPCPSTQNVHFAPHAGGSTNPNLFAFPDEAIKQFRFTATGQRGQRNVLRADGYGSLDLGFAKSFGMPYSENHKLQFRWEIFNVANSAHFDAASLNASIEDPSTFGDYTQMLGGPRRMQVSLRYQF